MVFLSPIKTLSQVGFRLNNVQSLIITYKVKQVREELINMLKNKETEQSRELSALQQDLEHRMNIVGEVRRIFFSFIFDLYFCLYY